MSIQTYKAEVDGIKDLTHDVRQIDLRLIEPQSIIFKPGQFVSFEVPHLGTGRMMTRPYSIASSPSRSGRITLLFNLVSGGPGSTFLFGLNEGDEVQFKGPAGNYYLREDPGRELLFVATGTGIAPIWSMMLANTERAHPRPATLFWGLRSQRDLYYQKELTKFVGKNKIFTVFTTLSRPEADWTGEIGRVQRLIEWKVPSVKNLAVYLCGNSAMIGDATALLQKKGLCPIYREKYYDVDGAAEY